MLKALANILCNKKRVSPEVAEKEAIVPYTAPDHLVSFCLTHAPEIVPLLQDKTSADMLNFFYNSRNGKELIERRKTLIAEFIYRHWERDKFLQGYRTGHLTSRREFIDLVIGDMLRIRECGLHECSEDLRDTPFILSVLYRDNNITFTDIVSLIEKRLTNWLMDTYPYASMGDDEREIIRKYLLKRKRSVDVLINVFDKFGANDFCDIWNKTYRANIKIELLPEQYSYPRPVDTYIVLDLERK